MTRFFKIFITLIILITTTQTALAKWKYNPGDIVEGEVVFGKKDSFKLPPGKFTVGVISKENEWKDLLVYQIDKKSGLLRWSIQFYATGNTNWEWWNPPKFCKRTNVYFIQSFKGNKSYACWMVNHSRSDIESNKGFWAKVREYEIANKIKGPDIYVYFQHQYSRGPKVWGARYYYNPELDGVPKPKHLEWETNEFHKQRVMNYPKHEEFLKKFISVSAGFVDSFNITHNIKSSSELSLNARDYLSNASINYASDVSANNVSNKSISEELKNLKELLDTGVITKEEFEKAKKDIFD